MLLLSPFCFVTLIGGMVQSRVDTRYNRPRRSARFCLAFISAARSLSVPVPVQTAAAYVVNRCGAFVDRGAQEPDADAGVDDVQARDRPCHQLGLPAVHHHQGRGSTRRANTHEGMVVLLCVVLDKHPFVLVKDFRVSLYVHARY